MNVVLLVKNPSGFSGRSSGLSFLLETNMYLLLALLFIKHFLCDFYWQTPYMLKKSSPTGWFWPLTLHVATHSAVTLVIMLFFTDLPFAIVIAIAEFALHWAIDYWKAQKAKADFNSRAFWNYLGIDQMFHNMTYLAILFWYSLYMAGF